MGNGNRPTPEFRREAVRLALTSGRTRREIAEDLGIGLSTLTRWLSHERDASEPSEAPVDLHAELKRLRRENAVLKQERDILKKRSRALARLCAVETGHATVVGGGELPAAYWRLSTPLKNVA
ncbi:transposase, partial [Aurantimonas sp. DM33-3]|uniref:transposase n=1 Tax=Aurantimonas sp. DM33-3 TaxID=2766955 RepID=UPI001FEF2C58